ncbi:YgaP family membrane protein [Desulfuribacillus stibiiarsenatis]|uniref:YgaP family membrane protein n=1 Tax=Desulfuribacillus stibiiarsenatis TaxID=1390249 RepID=UPI0009F63932|nr:DUF2892 domain-containing protein [Desulfuribacillus stibiiarsenatis]
MKYHLDFQKNLGDIDRMIRVMIGILLLLLVATRTLKGSKGIWATVIAVSQFIEGGLAY